MRNAARRLPAVGLTMALSVAKGGAAAPPATPTTSPLPLSASVPIVAFTGKVMAGDRERCLAAGATDYVAKPVDLEQLLSILRVCIAGSDTGHSAQAVIEE